MSPVIRGGYYTNRVVGIGWFIRVGARVPIPVIIPLCLGVRSAFIRCTRFALVMSNVQLVSRFTLDLERKKN